MTARRTGRRPMKARPRTAVARLLRRRGHTYTWLAEQTGYSRDHLEAVASGRRRPTGRLLKAVAFALGIPASEVV